jgi:outer membrane protein OmpA-like peptidoglycan-associated protein
MDEYRKLVPTDSRANEYSKANDFIEKLRKEPRNFNVSNFKEINSANSDFGAIQTPHGVLFASNRESDLQVDRKYAWDNKPFFNLFVAKKPDTSANMLIEKVSPKVNTRFHDGPACFNAAGNVMYFTRNNMNMVGRIKSDKGVTHLEIYKASFDGKSFTNIKKLPFNSDNYSTGHPALSPDGKKMYFTSNRPGGFGGTDLYYVEILGDTSYSQPVNMGDKINTEGNEMFPFMHETGMFFFASDGHVGLGGLDLFVSLPKEGVLQTPRNLGMYANSNRDDFALWLDPDQKWGYISSNRADGLGDDDIYKFTLDNPLMFQIRLKLNITDKLTTTPLSNVNLSIFRDGKLSDTLKLTDGFLSMSVDPDHNYSFSASLKGYLNSSVVISTDGIRSNKTIEQNIVLEKNPGFILVGLVTDKQTGKPLPNARIVVKDKLNNNTEVLNIVTDSTGSITKVLENNKVGDNLLYSVSLSCDGYLEKTLMFSKHLEKPGIINLTEALDLRLDKIEIGTDLAKIIDLKPIYFDLGKWAIRPDAAVELDKIVKVMTENPKMIIELRSHTDSRGDDASNMKLSDKRAKSSADYIVKKGIDVTRITGKGFGESQLTNRCGNGVKCTDQEHQQNRRTEFIIVKM